MKNYYEKLSVSVVVMLLWATASGPSQYPEVSWKYRQADLLIIADIISRTTRVIQERDPISTDGCVRHYTILVDIYTARVDTVLKGHYANSMIVILSQPIVRGDTCETQPLKVDEHGDSTLKAEVERDIRGKVNRINRYGKHIVLIQKQGNCYISLHSRPYKERYGRISGKVVDATTEEPLPLVTVVVDGTDMWGATDWDGYYDILSVRPGKYDVSVSMLGYGIATQTGVRVFKDSTSTVDFFLKPSVFK